MLRKCQQIAWGTGIGNFPPMKTLSLIDVSAIDDGFWLLQETSQFKLSKEARDDTPQRRTTAICAQRHNSILKSRKYRWSTCQCQPIPKKMKQLIFREMHAFLDYSNT
ncbi:unnamed protein product [Camellia sinensis]